METSLVQWDTIEATFSPKRLDDLKPEAADMVGMRLLWRVMWIIEDGPYKDLHAVGLKNPAGKMGWVPECDLTDIRLVDRVYEE